MNEKVETIISQNFENRPFSPKLSYEECLTAYVVIKGKKKTQSPYILYIEKLC